MLQSQTLAKYAKMKMAFALETNFFDQTDWQLPVTSEGQWRSGGRLQAKMALPISPRAGEAAQQLKGDSKQDHSRSEDASAKGTLLRSMINISTGRVTPT